MQYEKLSNIQSEKLNLSSCINMNTKEYYGISVVAEYVRDLYDVSLDCDTTTVLKYNASFKNKIALSSFKCFNELTPKALSKCGKSLFGYN